ncbi:MAG: nucleotidyl transferase AbiEii/AbiGii toxin family protein [Negativicutes bacterium]|nr:nucleotidyl transferase AbiEii/AbiGii toxin family protein [Negativicutes bacterium]
MIPEYAINQWRSYAPWNSMPQVEQDLIISRSLIELFNDAYLSSHLAFRGGTALHKLYLNPQVRYSEDLDLVQIYAEPIKETIEHIRDTLSFLGVPVIKQKANNNTLVFRMESEFAPVVPIRLKVEMNCREHFSVLGLTHSSFSVDNSWYSGSAQITIYKLDELLGTKLRALYQRKKGRDLFDLYHAITTADVNVDNIISCYRKYMEFVVGAVPGKKEYLANMEAKMQDPQFLEDTKGLLLPEKHFDPVKAYEVIRSRVLVRL